MQKKKYDSAAAEAAAEAARLARIAELRDQISACEVKKAKYENAKKLTENLVNEILNLGILFFKTDKNVENIILNGQSADKDELLIKKKDGDDFRLRLWDVIESCIRKINKLNEEIEQLRNELSSLGG